MLQSEILRKIIKDEGEKENTNKQNFRKFKMALNPLRRIFFKLCKKLHLIMVIIIQ